MKTAIILSGSYCGSELSAEFGNLPPAFLPLGNKLLLEHQVKLLENIHDRIILAIPKDFDLQKSLEKVNTFHDIEISRVNPNVSVGEVIFSLIANENLDGDALTILHGDTYFQNIPNVADDYVTIADRPVHYVWGGLNIDSKNISSRKAQNPNCDPIITGLCRISHPEIFGKMLHECGYRLLEALEKYSTATEVQFIMHDGWFDFGHIQTFYRSRCEFGTARSFNELTLSYDVVHKTGENSNKIEAEALWFEYLPKDLCKYVPNYLGRSNNGYKIEYLPYPTLLELFMFGRLSSKQWGSIFSSCENFLYESKIINSSQNMQVANIDDLVIKKTETRLDILKKESSVLVSTEFVINKIKYPSIEDIFNIVKGCIRETATRDKAVMHGDFCFSNIIFDFRCQRIRLIDPRGGADNYSSIYGDQRYDYAKFLHSVIGGYDKVISGDIAAFLDGSEIFVKNIKRNVDEELKLLALSFIDKSPYSIQELYPIVISLFISMLPLHSDTPMRQIGFIYCAYFLYDEWRKEE